MDEYRLLTIRDGRNGAIEYLQEVIFNGRKVDNFPNSLRNVFAEQSLTGVKYLEKHPEIDKVEFIIYGKRLEGALK